MRYIVTVNAILVVDVPDNISSPEEYADQIGHDAINVPEYAKEHCELDSRTINAEEE